MSKLSFKNLDFTEYYNGMCKQRVNVMRFAAESKENRAILYKQVSLDPIFFINNFVITYNPREKIKVIPMIMFPRQEEMLRFIQDCYTRGKWGTITKCRYTGASVVCTAFMLHKLMFEPDFSGSLSSNKADSVDKLGDPDCLFGKIESMYEWLPEWLKPFDIKQNRKIKLIQNPVTGGTIKGYSGDNIGRGGRSSLAILDESAHIERDTSAIAAMSENTDCAILVTTPNGKNNEHYRLHMSPEVESFMFYWHDDPRRDQAWADAQKLKLGEDIFNQELGCSFEKLDGEAYIAPSMIAKATQLQFPQEDVSDDIVAGLDLAISRDRNILCIRSGYKVLDIIDLGKGNASTIFNKLIESYDKYRFIRVVYDAVGVGDNFVDTALLINPEYEQMFSLIPYKGSSQSLIYDSQSGSYNNEVTYNLRAVSWRDMKRRIERTANVAEGLVGEGSFQWNDLIELPNNRLLLEDLSAPSFEYRGNKLLIQSKDDMRKLGIKSTDYADALMYAYYEGSGYKGYL